MLWRSYQFLLFDSTLKIFPLTLFSCFLLFDENFSGDDYPVSSSGSFDPYDLLSADIIEFSKSSDIVSTCSLYDFFFLFLGFIRAASLELSFKVKLIS